jgi:hypothetical protein
MRWVAAIWAAWLCAVVAFTLPPFLGNLDMFRQVDRNLYVLMLAALGAAVPAAVGYHFLRRRWFWHWEPQVLPIAFVVLCAIYSPGGVAVTLWMLAAAFAAGKKVAQIFGIPADFALSTLAGFGIFSVLLFILGMSRAFYPWVFALLFSLPIVLFWKCFRDLAKEYGALRSRWILDPELSSPPASIAVFASIILALIAATTLLAPAWNGDSITFHLPLMRVFLANHDLAVPPAIPYGYYPQGFEVLGAAAFALGGQSAAQFVNPVFFCLGIFALYRIARYCAISRSWAVVGIVLGISIPVVHWTGSVVKNDFPLVAYQFAALLCYFRWRETRVFRWILLSGFFIAMSLGVKNMAVFGAVPWALAATYSLWRQPRSFRRAVAAAAVVLAFGLLWQTRAYLATGNPLFPFFPFRAATSSEAAAHVPSQQPKQWQWPVLISAAYDVHFHGKPHFESPTQNPMGIVLLLMAPLFLLPLDAKTPRWTEGALWLFVILYYPQWVYSAAILRYAIAPILLLAVLGAARMALVPSPLAITAMGAALLFSIPIIALIEMAPAEIPFFLKEIDAATFLRRTLPPFGAVEFLSHHAQASDSIASVGDWAAAYTPNPAKFHPFYLTKREYKPSVLRRVLQPDDRYLILPNSRNLAQLEAAASQNRRLTLVYQDPHFVVEKLTVLSAAPLSK